MPPPPIGAHDGGTIFTGTSVSIGTGAGAAGASVSGIIGVAVPIDGVLVGGSRVNGAPDGESDGNVIGANVGDVVPGMLVVGAIDGTKGHTVDGGSPKSLCGISQKVRFTLHLIQFNELLPMRWKLTNIVHPEV